MKPGAKPISLEAHRLKGTFDASRHGKRKSAPAEPKKIDGADEKPARKKKRMPRPPAGMLGEVGQKEWNWCVRTFRNSGMFSERDRTQLLQYCLLVEELHELRHQFPVSKHVQLRLLAESLGISTVGGERR